jgi:two-component system KDP operon response regulator KdpE
MAPKIILIGDDTNLLKVLRRNLDGRGYVVTIVKDEAEIYELAHKDTPDLFILLIANSISTSPIINLCKALRDISQAPMIVVSSMYRDEIIIQALDSGADDFISIPFSMEEFLARVRAALRRWNIFQAELKQVCANIQYGELLIKTEARQVYVGSELITLTPKEYEVLLYLAQRKGKVITHRELLRAIWGPEYGDEREYLRVFIYQLRRKIEKDPLHPQYIQTVSGVGYRFGASD